MILTCFLTENELILAAIARTFDEVFEYFSANPMSSFFFEIVNTFSFINANTPPLYQAR